MRGRLESWRARRSRCGRAVRAVAVAMVLALLAACGAPVQAAQAPQTGTAAPAMPRGIVSQPAPASRYDLARDERRGGHTLERHVGKTDDDLRRRLVREPRVSAASTYADLATAERVVGETLARHRDRLRAWLDRDGSRPNLVLEYRGSRATTVGRSLRRGARAVEPCSDALVVLRWDRGRAFYVLTSYPEARR